MPELPEVETVRRGLAPVMTGTTVTRLELRRPDLRFPFPDRFVARVEGQVITGLSRRAKYLLAELSSGETLLMHLGMSGRFLIQSPGEVRAQMQGEFVHEAGRLPQHDHVVFHLSTGGRVIYNDARRFGFMAMHGPDEASPHLEGLGIEPLGNALSGEAILSLFDRKAAPLKAALLDQRLIAGLGNIYVCEALHRTGLHPELPAGRLSSSKAGDLAGHIRDVLNEALVSGGSTLRDFAHADGSLGYFQHAFRVYDREGEACLTPGCASVIARIVQSGRSTFFCPTCQKPQSSRRKRA
jgi:formamidopyrimidine-DNA glycosylase